jgi:twitching motility protein PilT
VSLSAGLVGTICQRLIPRADGCGRVPAAEIMVVNGRIQEAILDPLKTSQVDQIIAEGEYYGMQSFDQSVAGLMRSGVIELREAMNAASNPHDLKIMLERMGVLTTGHAGAVLAAS